MVWKKSLLWNLSPENCRIAKNSPGADFNTCFSLIGPEASVGEKRGWGCWSWMTGATSMVVPRSHQHLEMGQRYIDIPKLSGYNFPCWLPEKSINCHSLKDPLIRWIKIASQWFLPAWPVHVPFCQSSPGEESACIPEHWWITPSNLCWSSWKTLLAVWKRFFYSFKRSTIA